MTDTAELAPQTPRPAASALIPTNAPRWAVVAVGFGAAMLVLAVISRLTDTTGLTSSGTFGAMLRLGVPIMLAGLGGLYSERAGVVNIGLEGMMTLGTWFAAWAGYQWGPVPAVIAGVIGGALGGLLHAVATVTFAVDHIISGVALTILAAGTTRYLSSFVFVNAGASVSNSPSIKHTGDGIINIPKLDLPLLSGGELFGWRSPDVFGWFERRHWFFVSDVFGVLKGVTTDVSLLVVIALALVPFSAWLLWHTKFGLRLRSAGENPDAADSLGVSVYRMKYAGVVISGALAGLGGVILVLDADLYKEGQVGGRGFIGLAALIFGNYRPTGVAAGAGLFGYADGLQLRGSSDNYSSVHALLLLVAVACGLLAVLALWRKRHTVAIGLAVAGGLFTVWYFATDKLPSHLVTATAPVLTLVVLVVASQRLRPPTFDGIPWRKGGR
jgi:general nucleoside transport system permease protein